MITADINILKSRNTFIAALFVFINTWHSRCLKTEERRITTLTTIITTMLYHYHVHRSKRCTLMRMDMESIVATTDKYPVHKQAHRWCKGDTPTAHMGSILITIMPTLGRMEDAGRVPTAMPMGTAGTAACTRITCIATISRNPPEKSCKRSCEAGSLTEQEVCALLY